MLTRKLIAAFAVLFIISGCTRDPPMEIGKKYGIYQTLLVTVANPDGIEGPSGVLKFGEVCALTNGGSVDYVQRFPVGGHLVRYNGGGSHDPVTSDVYVRTAGDLVKYDTVTLKNGQCPNSTVFVHPYYNELAALASKHNDRVNIRNAVQKALVEEKPKAK